MEVPMRSRLVLLILSLCLILGVLGCTSKPAANNSASDPNQPADASNPSGTNAGAVKNADERREAAKRTIVVPAGTSIAVSLGSALGSKLRQTGQSFKGTVARGVVVGNTVVIPRGAPASGTVTDAKALGKFAGGALLQLRLNSISVNGR